MYKLVRGNLNQFWSRTVSVAWASLTSAWEIVLPGWPTGARQQLSSVNSYRWSFSSQAGSNACLQHGLLCWWGSSLSQGSCQHQWLHTMWLWVAFYFGFHHCHIWTRNYVRLKFGLLEEAKSLTCIKNVFPSHSQAWKCFADCRDQRPEVWGDVGLEGVQVLIMIFIIQGCLPLLACSSRCDRALEHRYRRQVVRRRREYSVAGFTAFISYNYMHLTIIHESMKMKY